MEKLQKVQKIKRPTGNELSKQQLIPSSDSLPSVVNDVMYLNSSLLILLNSSSNSKEGQVKAQDEKYFPVMISF